jgi:LuxR family maltose regulon positive regulatory protein
MPKKSKNQVRGTTLVVQSDGRSPSIHIRVESKEWFSWLEKNTGFSFRDGTDYFTARKEQIKGKGNYWYAYRRHGKKTRKKYLGKSHKLSMAHLREVSAKLSNATNIQQKNIPSLISPINVGGSLLKDDSLLLSTKFIHPSLPPDMVYRPRLMEQINVPIICVTAPAGFGKTTLVIEWLQEQKGIYTWISLDNTDNDPQNFWFYILTALKRLSEDFKQKGLVWPDFQSTQNIWENLIRLINSLQSLEEPLWLVMDDFHTITNQDIHSALRFLLEHRPRNLNIIFTSRTKLPFSLGSLRAKNQFKELVIEDLRFTKLEGVAYFDQKRDVLLSEKEMALLLEQTEGWVTGLHLASLALRHEKNVRRYLQQLEGSSRYLEEYYLDAILLRESETVQNFLLQISTLKHFNSNLCNAVTNRDDSIEMLTYLEHENLFISKIPHRQGWYRFHAMFANALSTELIARHPDLRTILHQRAAVWFQEKDLPEDSVQHYLLAQNWEMAAILIKELAPALILRGEVHRLRQWLDHLPETILQTHTSLYFTYVRVNEQSLTKIVHWLENARMDRNSCFGETQPAYENPDRLINFFSAAERDLSHDQTSTSEAYHVLWQEIDLMLFSLSRWMEGDWQNARQSLERAMNLSFTHNHRYIALQTAGMLVMQHMNKGRLREGERIIQQVREHFQLGLSNLPMLMVLALCYIRFEQNQLDVAYSLLQDGIKLRKIERQGEIFIRTQLILARVQSALGRQSEAEEVMQNIIKENIGHVSPWITLAELRAYQAHLWLLHGRLGLAEGWLQQSGMTADDALTQENSYAQLIHAQILIHQGKPEIANRLLNRLQAAFPTGLRTEPYLRLLLPQSLALFRLGKVNQAIQGLRKTLQMTQPEGYIRPFLACGAEMYTLLYLIRKQGRTSKAIQKYIQKLLRELKQLHTDIHHLAMNEINALILTASISPREQEILQLTSEGYPNQAIAEELFITLNTVKSHLRRIYQKLEVKNRTEAIMRARELQIIRESLID